MSQSRIRKVRAGITENSQRAAIVRVAKVAGATVIMEVGAATASNTIICTRSFISLRHLYAHQNPHYWGFCFCLCDRQQNYYFFFLTLVGLLLLLFALLFLVTSFVDFGLCVFFLFLDNRRCFSQRHPFGLIYSS